MGKSAVLRLGKATMAFVLTVSLCGGYGEPVSASGVGVSGREGSTCYAGNYVCPMGVPMTRGSTCACPGIGAPSYGIVN